MKKYNDILKINYLYKHINEEYRPIDLNHPNIINQINEIANIKNLPKIKKKLDAGREAMAFESEDPNIIIRISSIENSNNELEYMIENEEIKETGGIAKIYDYHFLGDDGEYLITWKEKVDDGFILELSKKYSDIELKQIITTFKNLCVPKYSKKYIPNLKKWPETVKLYQAITMGLPTWDLNIDKNIGMNQTGDIVAYDC